MLPGNRSVLGATAGLTEHPAMVAERIARYAERVGRESVIAGSDCGLGASAWGRPEEADIVWAKLQAMPVGARLASEEPW
jgi:5-methyltetrahydropteroyltriglutamate--homocysteine methyltransferase